MRLFLRAIVAVLVAAALAAAIPQVRRSVLGGVGRYLAESDAPGEADLLAVDGESTFAGAIKTSDLYRAHPSPAVAVFVLRKNAIDNALRERRVVLPDIGDVLEQLGVPRHAIARFPVDDVGTTETTGALTGWSRANPTGRVVVVVGPSHGRRYRRALRRLWPQGHPEPRVVVTQYALFRADDWWQSRTTVREGLVEIEKLGLDYLRHPWPSR
jgi:hypothetical protein